MTALDREIAELHRRGVRVRFIGERERFSDAIQARMLLAERTTVGNARLALTIAASYGGRQDIAAAARGLAEDVVAGRLQPEQIDEALFASRVALADLPPPDLFIRTGGDFRVSNFMSTKASPPRSAISTSSVTRCSSRRTSPTAGNRRKPTG